ncbi:MAG: SPOR domain-containing protein, partial [Pseudomonadota bacterium]
PAPRVASAPAAPRPAPVVRRSASCAGLAPGLYRTSSGTQIRCGGTAASAGLPRAPQPVQPQRTQRRVASVPAAPQPAARTGAARVSSVVASSGIPRRILVSPQSGATRTAPRTGRVVSAETVRGLPGQTRIVPRQVYEGRFNTGFQPVPDGYRRVWTDDRLNTRRAEQTAQGYRQTRLIWTNTVPRRLIDHATGRDVTASTPLVYPYTDTVTQNAQLGQVTLVRRNGQIVKRVQRNRGTRAAPVVTRAPTPVPTLSTRSAPKPSAAPRSASTVQGSGMVQAALYRDDAGARAAAQRVAALGLPVRLGTVPRRGETLKAVMVGPFRSGNAQVGALRRVRAAGFANARLR